jgi:TetR/AcrR family transcriptional regulator, lmrAB and yxaGH operons repressor
MEPGPRARLVGAAIALVREKGVEGTGLAELLERSNTARRSLYQHFPGGKHELIGHSTRSAGRFIERALQRGSAGAGSAASLAAILDQLIADAEATEFRLGCPVAAAAAAPADATEVITAAGAAFAGWTSLVEEWLVAEGLAQGEARSLAGFLVSSIEGALLCARAARSAEPLQQAKEQLMHLLDERRRATPVPGTPSSA